MVQHGPAILTPAGGFDDSKYFSPAFCTYPRAPPSRPSPCSTLCPYQRAEVLTARSTARALSSETDGGVRRTTLPPGGGLSSGPGRAECTTLTLTPAPALTAASDGAFHGRAGKALACDTLRRQLTDKSPLFQVRMQRPRTHLGSVFLLTDPSRNTTNRFQRSKNCTRIDWSGREKPVGSGSPTEGRHPQTQLGGQPMAVSVSGQRANHKKGARQCITY